ncbi:MAG: glycosyltransferase [Lachnospiraceae bacterium]|nr:glycosyltransferase [Lachnospiraceae bacterium]
MFPQISIIIPVYKVEKYLNKCLDSIVNQVKGKEAEVIIIDDGSPDSSGEIADRYASEYPFIKVIHKENEGVASARNTGIDLSEGAWLYFMDSDDWMAEGAIDILLCKTKENPGADVILMDAWKNVDGKEDGWEHFREEFSLEGRQKISRLQRGALYFPGTGMGTKIPLAAPWDKVYRKKFLDRCQIRFKQELKVLDDMVFNMEVFGEADNVVYCKEKIYHYRYVPDSITNSYKPDRVSQDCQVWKYINNYMAEYFQRGSLDERDEEELTQAYYCRIIKSFSICCRLCFFNPLNKAGLKEKIKYVKETLGMEPYRTAFREVRMKKAEWKLKAVILMGRCRFGVGIYMLHIAQSILG